MFIGCTLTVLSVLAVPVVLEFHYILIQLKNLIPEKPILVFKLLRVNLFSLTRQKAMLMVRDTVKI